MADDPTPVFEQYPVGSWTLGSGRAVFYVPIQEIKEGGGNRIIRRRRPFRKGAKLDNTGANEKVWTVTICFDNSIDEPGLSNPPDKPLYPTILNEIIESIDVGDTGTFTLPTRGGVRCRVETYERLETFGERDSAMLTLVIVEDNEDAIDAASFTNPTVRATVQQTVDETVFGMESLGGFSQFLADLEDAATNLQDAIAAPGEAIQDLDQKAARVIRIASDIEKQFLVSAQLGRDLLTDPDSWATIRQLGILQDRTARAVSEKSSPIAPIVTAVFATDQSIYDIAVQLTQNPSDLSAINGDIEDLLFIPAGTVVHVFQPTSA